MAKLAKSYHTFIFPFIWQHEDRKEIDFATIINNFNKSDIWGDDDLQDYQKIGIECSDDSQTDFYSNMSKYAMYQYFQPAIREAIFGKKNKNAKKQQKDVVQNFTFKPIDSANESYYSIVKNGIIYKLYLTSVKLRIYNTGVGLLCFVCENRDYNDIETIKRINDYGRRISLPFFPKKSSEFFLCADILSVSWDESSLEEDFTNYIDSVTISGEDADFHHVADFIIKILNHSSEENIKNGLYFTTDESKKDDKYIFIQPALDDRMFVMCAVNNTLKNFFAPHEYSYVTEYLKKIDSEEKIKDTYRSESFEKSLYELIFCDPPNGCSCQSAAMRKKLIKDHLYSRWLGFGTLYSIAAQAFIVVCDGNAAEHIFTHFHTMYYEMICLVLVQRTSLRQFQNEASYLSAHVEDRNRKVDKQTRQDIANLQEKLIAFQNQINLYEISSQEQAIELYDMMRDVFLVSKHTSILQEQLDGLYNIANIHQSNNISHWALVVAGAAIVIAMPSFWGDSPVWPGHFDVISVFWDDMHGCGDNSWSGTVFWLKVLVLIGLGVYIWSQRNK